MIWTQWWIKFSCKFSYWPLGFFSHPIQSGKVWHLKVWFLWPTQHSGNYAFPDPGLWQFLSCPLGALSYYTWCLNFLQERPCVKDIKLHGERGSPFELYLIAVSARHQCCEQHHLEPSRPDRLTIKCNQVTQFMLHGTEYILSDLCWYLWLTKLWDIVKGQLFYANSFGFLRCNLLEFSAPHFPKL